MDNLILIVVLILVVGAAIAYIVHEKRRGVKCIGCPVAGTCSQTHLHTAVSGCGGNCRGCAGCGHTKVNMDTQDTDSSQ